MLKEITGIVLAGGSSSRFGQDKALLPIGGKRAIEIAVDLLKSLFPHLLISARTTSDYAFLGLPVISDLHPEAGPLAGLHAALHGSTTARNCVISCDLPLMHPDLIRHLVTSQRGHQIVLATAAGRLQFFPGLYDRSLLPLIEAMFARQPQPVTRNRSLSLYALMEQAASAVIDVTTLPFYREAYYLNMNTPQDYEQILRFAAMREG